MIGRNVARDITYAHSARSLAGRTVIRAVENATGRFGLIRRARGYEQDIAAGQCFWDVLVSRYNLTLDLVAGALENIPTDGPLVVISNHPYGILDGLMLGHIMARTRGDFRILANHVFRKSEELNRVVLPISFDETPEAVRLNVKTRKFALEYLSGGGCVAIFPGGTVSTARRPFGTPMDPGWRTFTAKLIAKSGACVVPVYFEGQNSRAFQLASHVHPNLRVALLIREFRKRVGGDVRAVIGTPLDPAEIAARKTDARALMDYLRAETYRLSPTTLTDLSYGYEFEAQHRRDMKSD